jgi:hypothetical protein
MEAWDDIKESCVDEPPLFPVYTCPKTEEEADRLQPKFKV